MCVCVCVSRRTSIRRAKIKWPTRFDSVFGFPSISTLAFCCRRRGTIRIDGRTTRVRFNDYPAHTVQWKCKWNSASPQRGGIVSESAVITVTAESKWICKTKTKFSLAFCMFHPPSTRPQPHCSVHEFAYVHMCMY